MATWSWPATVKVHQHLQGTMITNDAVKPSEAQTQAFLDIDFLCVCFLCA